jgi:hypothetical protein
MVKAGAKLKDFPNNGGVTEINNIIEYPDKSKKKVPFMTRFVLYKNKFFQVRIHLIPDPSEGFLHNHANSFFSYCFNGSYTHKIWKIEESDTKLYYEDKRLTKNGEYVHNPIPNKGEKKETDSYTHHKGIAYYIYK